MIFHLHITYKQGENGEIQGQKKSNFWKQVFWSIGPLSIIWQKRKNRKRCRREPGDRATGGINKLWNISVRLSSAV